MVKWDLDMDRIPRHIQGGLVTAEEGKRVAMAIRPTTKWAGKREKWYLGHIVSGSYRILSLGREAS